jgi:hypothetical protein
MLGVLSPQCQTCIIAATEHGINVASSNRAHNSGMFEEQLTFVTLDVQQPPGHLMRATNGHSCAVGRGAAQQQQQQWQQQQTGSRAKSGFQYCEAAANRDISHVCSEVQWLLHIATLAVLMW